MLAQRIEGVKERVEKLRRRAEADLLLTAKKKKLEVVYWVNHGFLFRVDK